MPLTAEQARAKKQSTDVPAVVRRQAAEYVLHYGFKAKDACAELKNQYQTQPYAKHISTRRAAQWVKSASAKASLNGFPQTHKVTATRIRRSPYFEMQVSPSVSFFFVCSLLLLSSSANRLTADTDLLECVEILIHSFFLVC